MSPFTGFYKDPEEHLLRESRPTTRAAAGARRDNADGSEFFDGEIISQFDAVIDFAQGDGVSGAFRLAGAAGQFEFPDDGNAWARLSDKPDERDDRDRARPYCERPVMA